MIAINKRTKKRYIILGIEKPLPIMGGVEKVIIKGKKKPYRRNAKNYEIVEDSNGNQQRIDE